MRYIYIHFFVNACSNNYEIFVDTNMNLSVCERFSGSVNLTINTMTVTPDYVARIGYIFFYI